MINCESHPEDRHCHDACERQHPWGSQTGVTAGSRGRPGEPPELRFLPLRRSSREGERGLGSDLPITRQKPGALEEATASPELPGHAIQIGQRRRPAAPPPFPEPRHRPVSTKEAGHREPPAECPCLSREEARGSCVMSPPCPLYGQEGEGSFLPHCCQLLSHWTPPTLDNQLSDQGRFSAGWRKLVPWRRGPCTHPSHGVRAQGSRVSPVGAAQESGPGACSLCGKPRKSLSTRSRVPTATGTGHGTVTA